MKSNLIGMLAIALTISFAAACKQHPNVEQLVGRWQEKTDTSHTIAFTQTTWTSTYMGKTFTWPYYYDGKDGLSFTDSSGTKRKVIFQIKGDDLDITYPDAAVKDVSTQHFVRMK